MTPGLLTEIADRLRLTPPAARAARRVLTDLEGKKARVLAEQYDLLGSFANPYDRFRGGEVFGGWGGTAIGWAARDRTNRQNEIPAGLMTEEQLRLSVALARWVCERNKLAIGFLNHVINFVVGDGFKWQVAPRGAGGVAAGGGADLDGDGEPDADPAVAACQAALDEWRHLAGWGQAAGRPDAVDLDGDDATPQADREAEGVRRAVRDGEAVLRFFAGGRETRGLPTVRWVEPELVRAPAGGQSDERSYGVEHRPGDAETRVAYHVLRDPADPVETEAVPAGRVAHLKFNADGTQKRGVTDFLPVAEDLERAGKLLRNMGEVAAIQAAIAFVTQHAPGVTGTQVSALLQAGKDYSAPRGPFPDYPGGAAGVTTGAVNYADPGKHLHINNGSQFVAGPVQAGAAAFVAVEQAVLRAVGLRWGCPEYFSGDASNANFASTLVSGGPFERAVKRRQKDVAAFQQAVAVRVLAFAVRSGRLSAADVARVTVLVTPPSVAIANKVDDANYSQVMYSIGASPQTILQQQGFDPELEAANREAWDKRFPEGGGAPAPDTGDDPDDPFGDDPDDDPDDGTGVREGVGPPPFPGAVFDRSKHRWVKPGDRPAPGRKKPRPAADTAALRAKAVAAYLDGTLDRAGGKAYRFAKAAVRAAEQGMAVVMKRTQAVAAQAARERGLPDDHVARVGRVLAAVDFAASFGLSKGTAALTGGNPLAGFAAGMLPSASVAYLAYSTARDPRATLRAAAKYVRGELAVSHEAADETGVLSLLAYFEGAADPDWAEAVLAAALDAGAGLPAAVRAAGKVLAARPAPPA